MRPRRCRQTADPGSGCPCCSRSGPCGAAVFLAWQFLAYRRFVAELSRRRAGARRASRPAADRKRRRRRGRSRSACFAAGSSSRPISRAAIRPRSAASRSIMRRSTIAAATCGGTISASLILALNWFNPVAWLAFRAFRADQELACDAAVAAAAPADDAPRLCARPDQIREPTRPDRSLPAQSCRPTETETEDDEVPQAEPAAHARRRRRDRHARRAQPRRRQPRPRPARRPSSRSRTRPRRAASGARSG